MINSVYLVLSGFVFALAAPWFVRLLGRRAKWVIAIYPGAVTTYVLANLEGFMRGEELSSVVQWVPSLGVYLSFAIDGLGSLFGLIIAGIGFLIVLYGGGYMKGNPQIGRFYAFLLMFMSSMLGVVFSSNLIGLFIFWELTSISSYLLIGFKHEQEKSRKGALQALLVTGIGGIAMLVGFILLGMVAGTYDIGLLEARSPEIIASPMFPVIFGLIIAGALTKSAQFPFHIWLPNAMVAPTPVSAYLHSATMVKAGVFLLMRFIPILGGTPEWHYTLPIIGAVTMMLGSLMAFFQHDLKRILAYTTVNALGTMVFLIGLDTTEALKAAVIFLVIHSLYKGALFMIAGSIDHSAGTRNVDELGGLLKAMPVTASAAIFAALSMSGLPPMLGFIGKELIYEANVQAPQAAKLITSMAVTANVFIVASAAVVGVIPFFGARTKTPTEPHEVHWTMLTGPVVLAFLGLFLGLFPGLLSTFIVDPALSAIHPETLNIKISFWHGFNLVFFLSVVTVAAGISLFVLRGKVLPFADRVRHWAHHGPEQAYENMLRWLNVLAFRQTAFFQNGLLRSYVLSVLLFSVSVFAAAFLLLNVSLPSLVLREPVLYELIIVGLMVFGGLVSALSNSRLLAIAGVGVVGYGISLLFVFYSAPDLAMTQFAVESLTIVLFMLVIRTLPRLKERSSKATKTRDWFIASISGVMVTLLLLMSIQREHPRSISNFYADASYLFAEGKNVVNVILVDFRAFDTLGEITVLALAAIGIVALMNIRPRKGGAEDDTP